MTWWRTMMLLNMDFFNNNLTMIRRRVTSVITFSSLEEPADDSYDDTAAATTHDSADNTSVVWRSLVDGVLVVSILPIVEVVAITIIVNDKEDCRVIPNSIVIVWRQIIFVEGS
jgi:hypothetical protein